MTAKNPAATFRAMAERIDKNPDEFQGCYLIISPNGDILSQAFFDPKGDNVQFWGFLAGAVQIAAVEAQQAEEAKMGLLRPGMRR